MSKKLVLTLAVLLVSAVSAQAEDIGKGGLPGYEVGTEANLEGMERVVQVMVDPPAVPEHTNVAKGGPKIIEVRMTIEEKELEIEPGVFVWAFAFNGTVPGPTIVAHVGDQIEFTLVNPKSNELSHNMDFHASTGALGGGAISHVAPGEEVTFRWKAIKPGTHVYHCAPGGEMIPWHTVHGMNGGVMILPRDGLKDKDGKLIEYDKAYYIGEQDWYLPKDKYGKYKRYKNPFASFGDDKEVMTNLIPSHIIMGGIKGGLTGENTMRAKVGETVLFIHQQANRQSYPHLIGGHGDYVWERGNFGDAPMTDLETWEIAAGSTGAFIYTFRQPGTYVYLSHNLIEAFMMGDMSTVKVEGAWNNDLMERLYLGPIRNGDGKEKQ